MKQFVPSRRFFRFFNILASFLLCLSATFFAFARLSYPLTGIDDANIYFVYARHLANGYGFVYNIGGERVEGFTSLLWTIISAVAFKFSTFPEIILLILNILLISLGIAYALHYLQTVPPEQAGRVKLFWSVLFLVILFTSPRYIVWNTITLMENALWSTLLLVTTIFVIQAHPSSRTINIVFLPLSILLLLARPESLLWVMVFLAVLFLRLAFSNGIVQALKALAPSIAGIPLTMALLTIFRLQYFGYPLPNTYYAKVSPYLTYNLEQGTLYLVRYLISDPIATVAVPLVFLACIYSLLRVSPAKGEFYLPFLAATGLLVPLLTGGDHFGSFRFYQNVYPITLLCLIQFLRAILHEITRNRKQANLPASMRAYVLPGLVVILLVGFGMSQSQAWSSFPPEIQAEFDIAKYERLNGAFMQDLFASLPRVPSVGVIAAGGVKYAYSGEIVDLVGLNNTTMAHNHGKRIGYKGHAAFEKETFFQLQPQVLLPFFVNDQWQYSETELHNRWENTLAFKGLFDDPQFLNLYGYAKVCKVSGCDMALVAWFRKDFLESLKANGNYRLEQYDYSP